MTGSCPPLSDISLLQMRDDITVYDAKFTVYSTYEVLETVNLHLDVTDKISEEDVRKLRQCKDDLHKILSKSWDLGKV